LSPFGAKRSTKIGIHRNIPGADAPAGFIIARVNVARLHSIKDSQSDIAEMICSRVGIFTARFAKI
jgi:hypothetical protein